MGANWRPRVRTQSDLEFESNFAGQGGDKSDSYPAKVLKHIPGDFLAGAILVNSMLAAERKAGSIPVWGEWTIFATLTATAFFIGGKGSADSDRGEHFRRDHAISTAVAFACWQSALGPPFTLTWSGYSTTYGAIAGVIFGLIAPLLSDKLLGTKP